MRKCLSLVLPRDAAAIMLQHLFIPFPLYNLSSGRLLEFKSLKVILVAYERLPLTRDSKYSDFTWKLMVFWKTGHCEEGVAYERW